MSDSTRIISNRKHFTKAYILFAILCCVLGLVLQAHRSLASPYPIPYFFINFLYFTTQSNILVLIVLILHFSGFISGRYFVDLVHISLVNILITGVGFHLFLGPYITLTLLQHLLHTVSPILYLIYYFFINRFSFNLKRFWILFLYPILYFLSIYLVIHPLMGDTLEMVQGDFRGTRYVYPFFDPFYFQNNYVFMILFFLISIASFIGIVLLFTQPIIRWKQRKMG